MSGRRRDAAILLQAGRGRTTKDEEATRAERTARTGTAPYRTEQKESQP